jgi:hypothetical protein
VRGDTRSHPHCDVSFDVRVCGVSESDVELLRVALRRLLDAAIEMDDGISEHRWAIEAARTALAEPPQSDRLRDAGKAAVAWWREASRDGPREAHLYGALAAAIERVEAAAVTPYYTGRPRDDLSRATAASGCPRPT